MATFLRYRGKSPLGGVICLLGMNVYDTKKVNTRIHPDLSKTPIFLYNNQYDRTMPTEAAYVSYNDLNHTLYDEKQTYWENWFHWEIERDVGHEITPKMMDVTTRWIT